MSKTLDDLREQFTNSPYSDAALFFEQCIAPEETDIRYKIPITETYEELSVIPLDIKRWDNHPYKSLGAPYKQSQGPYSLRHNVVQKLLLAQEYLHAHNKNYFLKIFDAYRPLAVQAFMIEYEVNRLVENDGLDPTTITSHEKASYKKQVMQFWAEPETDLDKPPPHSTGCAVDLTIADKNGEELDMGSPIDFIGNESFPNFFANKKTNDQQLIHQNRELLNSVMSKAGFRRLPYEWWHFSYGDNWWALLSYLEGNTKNCSALYGRIIDE